MEFTKSLECLSSITGLPISILDENGAILNNWPKTDNDIVFAPANLEVIGYFRISKRDVHHPLIIFLDPGFLLGMIQLDSGQYVLIGLVSPYRHSREDVLRLVSEAIHPGHLQQFCDSLINQPLISQEQLKDLICLITRLADNEAAPENIMFADLATEKKLGSTQLEQSLFEQREEQEYHVPVDFETSVCTAIEMGDRVLLERTLFSPVQGKVGRMSSNDLRQQKYTFICMATLVSRAAIRGGLNPETAFSLSDLYCQRADLLTEIPLIQNLTFTMLMDFCGKVREIKKRPATSATIEKCLDYISVHLHDAISLDQLSDHCGLCGRSLSIRFRNELGMGIPEYIHREKIKEAEYLLRSTDYSLAQITSFLNYTTQSYFTSIFRKYTGQTPQQYRDS